MIADNVRQAQAELLRKQQEAKRERNGHEVRPIRDISPLPANPPAPVFQEPEQLSAALAAGRVSLDTLDTSHPKMRQAVHMAREWAERKRRGCNDASLVLCGDNGVGKTHIARAIWWSIVLRVMDAPDVPGQAGKPRQGYECSDQPLGKFTVSNDLIAGFGSSTDPETGVTVPVRAADRIGYPPMLIIDDVGLEQSIQFVGKEFQEAERHARFFSILNHCYGNVSVIITTNLDWARLSTHIGKRAADRLQQMAPRMASGDSFIVDLFGVPSYRRKVGGR